MSMMAVYGAQRPQDALREREEKLAAAHAETALLTERWGNPAEMRGGIQREPWESWPKNGGFSWI